MHCVTHCANCGRFCFWFSCRFHRYKWVCSLRGNNDFHFCGCSLIAPSVVLTAAHCLDQADTSLSRPWVEVGVHFLYIDNPCTVVASFQSAHVHYSLSWPALHQHNCCAWRACCFGWQVHALDVQIHCGGPSISYYLLSSTVHRAAAMWPCCHLQGHCGLQSHERGWLQPAIPESQACK